MNIWEFFLYMFWIYILISCIFIFVMIIVDLFRDHSLNGWGKALWIIFLVVLPFLAALVYLIARGKAMGQRNLERAAAARQDQDSYIRSVAGTPSSSAVDDIAQAKTLLDSGAITQAEFDTIKTKALASA